MPTSSRRPCYHRWSAAGRCVSPGCTQSRPKDQLGGRPAPYSLDLEQRARIIELLPTHTNSQIVTATGISSKTVAKVRREEQPG